MNERHSSTRHRRTRRPGFLLWTLAVATSIALPAVFAAFLLARRFDEIAPPSGLGAWALVLLPAPLVAQTIFTTRKGYVYCGRTETIARSEDPTLYGIWVAIQLVAAVSAMILILGLVQGREFWASV